MALEPTHMHQVSSFLATKMMGTKQGLKLSLTFGLTFRALWTHQDCPYSLDCYVIEHSIGSQFDA